MKSPNLTAVAVAFLFLAPLPSQADLTAYSQDFESLAQASPTALGADGWKAYGNVFNFDGSFAYGYGTFAAPNGTPGFSSIAVGQGGLAQGSQQLVVYSDYNNPSQTTQWVEALVFQEQTVGATDSGTWTFQFDAKRGDLSGVSTAYAFIKTLNPAAGFATTNFVSVDMTSIPTDWNQYTMSLAVDPSLSGQLFQFGFAARATDYTPSGVFYDNVSFATAPIPEPAGFALLLAGLALIGPLVRRRGISLR